MGRARRRLELNCSNASVTHYQLVVWLFLPRANHFKSRWLITACTHSKIAGEPEAGKFYSASRDQRACRNSLHDRSTEQFAHGQTAVVKSYITRASLVRLINADNVIHVPLSKNRQTILSHAAIQLLGKLAPVSETGELFSFRQKYALRFPFKINVCYMSPSISFYMYR